MADADSLDVRLVWKEWLGRHDWLSMLTLTFRGADRVYDVGAYEAYSYWRTLVQIVNRDLLGNHYTRRVGHSYFGYLLGMESGDQGQHLHMHVLVDMPVHYDLINRVWHRLAGASTISFLRSPAHAVDYVLKYVLKGGDVRYYVPRRYVVPRFVPSWWLDAEAVYGARRGVDYRVLDFGS